MKLIYSSSFLLLELALLLSGGVLVLLILRDEVVHVGLGFSEFHLVHTLTSVPVEESLSAEHGSELFTNTLEHFLDGSWVTEEGNWHLETLWWDIADAWFDVVGDPFNEVAGVLVLNVKHLFINFFGWHATTEHSGGS